MADYRLNQPGATIQEAIDIALEIQGDLEDEIAAREAADALLATKTELQSEANARQAADAEKASLTQLANETNRAQAAESALGDRIDAIGAKIPSEASSSNQLADKNFVNSSIGTSTANYISNNGYPFTSVAQLNAYTGPHDNNDYAFVVSTDAEGNTVYSRYKFNGSTWAKEYDLNNSSFTADQWAAINSLMTSNKTQKLDALPTASELATLFSGKQDVIADLATIRAQAAAAYVKPSGGIPKTDLASAVQTSLNKADSAIQDVSNKADKDTDAVEGNVAKFDANGNPVDGGVPMDNVAQKDGYYGGLTAGSAENLVGRGSVEAEIQGIRTSAGQEDIGTGAAMIREVRGKSLVWNQLVNNGNFSAGNTGWTVRQSNGIVDTNDGITMRCVTGASVYSALIQEGKNNIAGHKYYCSFSGKKNECPISSFKFTFGDSWAPINNPYLSLIAKTEWARSSAILVAPSNSDSVIITPTNYINDADNIWSIKNFVLIDLTLMFGAGDEPATPEEFERMFFLPYYEHNAGTIINNEAIGLRTRGFNLYNPVTGKAVLPGKYSDYPYEYEICGSFTSISFEDYAGNVSTPEPTDGRFFNVDAPGELTVVGGNATNTCVHLVWSGWRNYSEPDYVYVPYWENTLPINIKTITGKLNGEVESVVIFPNGMRGAGTAYDRLIVDPDGFARRAEVRNGSVDMGTLSWSYNSTYKGFVTSDGQLPGVKSQYNGICSKYEFMGSYNRVHDMECGYIYNIQLIVKDSSFGTDVAAFKAAMNGVLLDYERATPLEYILDEPIPLTYMVDDFGTEAKLPIDTAELPTGPLRFAVTYPFNAVDKLRRLSTNYLSKESTEAMLNALQSAGIIGGYTMTYNATTEQYIFTITAPNVTPDETTE